MPPLPPLSHPSLSPALLALGCVLALSGCTMEPDYVRPDAPVPTTFPANDASDESPPPSQEATASAPASAPEANAASIPWSQFITDERLRTVIATAMENNRDLRIATLNVERARSMYGIQRSELLPTVNANASMSRQRTPGDASGVGMVMSNDRYDVNLGVASWEIDLFGRIRSLEKESLQQFFATEQARRGAQVLLVAEVAKAYLTLAADRENLRLAQTTLQAQQNSFSLIQRRYERGLSPELDFHRAKSQVDSASVLTARFKQQVDLDRNALNLLVGSPISDELLPVDLDQTRPMQELPLAMSSEVLLLRPDVLEAEYQLKAANANIGAARAAFFPRISLTGSFGTASGDLSGLFGPGSAAWSYSPQIVMPIFDARTWSAEEVSQADQKLALAKYEKAIQTSFREVADALAIAQQVKQQVDSQQSLVDSMAQTHRLSNARYAKGIDSYLSVLDAQRSLFAAQQDLVSLRLAKFVNHLQLYAVLGGGWRDSQDSSP